MLYHWQYHGCTLHQNNEKIKADLCRWHRGVAVECRTCDQEVTGSSLGRAPQRKNHRLLKIRTDGSQSRVRELGSIGIFVFLL